jgi:hypothetical protein
MKKGEIRLLTAGFLCMQALLWADVQWLSYHTSDRAQDIIGGSSQFNRLEETSPTDVKLPELSTEDPKFIKWKTTMDPKGFRWVVFDKKHQHGSYDILYIDSDGDGQLDDEQPYEGRLEDQYRVEFGSVPVYFEGDDGPITYHLNLRFYSYNEQSTYVYAYTGCWYEGQVNIGGKTQRCVLVDYNCNGAFDDKSDNFSCDRVLIGPEENYRTGWVGNFLEVDKSLYRLSIAKDGAFLELTDASDVAYGTVTMPESITSFSAGGLNGMFERTVENGKVTLPLGQYRIYSWEIARKDDKNVAWVLSGSGFPQGQNFTVAEDAAATVDIGEPVYSQLQASDRNGMHYFNQGLVGKSGERISLTRDGRQPQAPRIHVRNKTGEYDRTFALEYG